MSQYNVDLQLAKARQQRLYIGVIIAVSSVFLILTVVFVLMKVTLVEVLPEDASETAIIEVKQGVGFAVGMKVYTFSSKALLEVSANGFASSSVEIPSGLSGKLQIKLSELSGKLSAKTSADDDAVRWLLDGRLVAVGGELLVDLNPGRYSLTVDSAYSEKQVIDVVLTRGEEKNLIVNLIPVTGHIKISSIPTGMPVTIDGKVWGVTPLSNSYAGGRYRLAIITPDFETLVDQLDVTNAAPEIERNYRLQAKKSYLSFSLRPAGGELLVNGRNVDSASLLAIDAAVKNTVTYLKKGYFSKSQNITMDVGEKSSMVFNLHADKGQIEIKSVPVADVFINGKPQGKTPMSLSLLAIKHQLVLSRKGYRSVTKTISPSSKKTLIVDEKLLEEGLATLAEAKRHYKNAMGMEFKLFKPKQLKMGAERHEKGQRANEFVRNIRFKKPFYAGLKEVTIGQYAKFKKGGESASPDNYPVTTISWLEAAKFCNWLSAGEKRQPFYIIQGDLLQGVNKTSAGYRLLTEAEWEWLARKAGRKNQTIFTWGNDFVVPPATGNIADESAGNAVQRYVPNYNDGYVEIAPVGVFTQDKAGLYDLTGNVSEWVHDYYSLVPPKNDSREIDPMGAGKGTNHVVKGSSWQSGVLTELRASFREGAKSGRQDTGFRVARYLYGEQDIE